MYNPFFSWHLDIPIVIGLLAAECIYVLLVRRLWHKAGHYDMRSAWSWSIGVAVILIALESPLDTIAEQRLLSAHMLQHELLLTIAPTLLLLGLFPRLVAPVTRAVFMDHLSFVTAGLLFWLPIIEPVPGLTKMRPLAKLAYLALGQLGTVPLVAALFWSPTLLYPYYASKLPLWGISHLSDQQWAGLVMMIVDMLAALTAVCWITLKALAWAEWQDNRPRPLHVSPSSHDR
ncbi:MAG: cytochrome c oxidase assembly protein [Chloroflexi bacterium]|nr:MAG: cytochrome c oxidase assembly protein [Chloroflexota bacterium]